MNWQFWLSVIGAYFLGICSGLILVAFMGRAKKSDKLADILWEKEEKKEIEI